MKMVRPSLEKLPVKAHRLLNLMWNDNPSERPDMETVLKDYLKSLTIGCTISDEEGLAFWNKKSPDSYELYYDDFILDFHDKFLGREGIKMTDFEILRLVFCTEGEQYVTIDSFNNVFNWFGPMRVNDIDIISRILELTQNEWFQGDITRIEAEGTLNQKFELANSTNSVYPFLVRLSSPEEKDTSVHPATISYYALKKVKNPHSKKKGKEGDDRSYDDRKRWTGI